MDIERCLEAMAPTASLVGLCLGLTVNRKWLALPIGIQAFLLVHALQGWAPPIPILRRLGVRTAAEIRPRAQCAEGAARRLRRPVAAAPRQSRALAAAER